MILDIDYICQGFGYYIETVFENDAIQAYLAWLKKVCGANFYEQFELIYNEVKSHKSAPS